MRIYQDKVGSSEQAFRNILSEGLLDKYASGLSDQKKKQLVDEVVNTLCLELERFLVDTQNQTVDQISGRLQTKLKNLGLNKIVFSDDTLQQISQALGGDQLQKFVQAFASINIEEKLNGLKKLFKSNKAGESTENAAAAAEKISEKNGIVQVGNKDEEEAEEQESQDKEFEKLSKEILDSDKKEFVKYCDNVLKNMVFFNGMLDRIYDNTIECIKPLLKVDKTLLASTIALTVVQGVLAGSAAMLSAANFQLAASYKYLSLSNLALTAANIVLSIANFTLSAANFVHAASVLILAASKSLMAAANVSTLVSVVSSMLSVILSLIMSAVSIIGSVIASAASIVISLIAGAITIAAKLVFFAVIALAAILGLQFQILAMAFVAAMAIILMVTQVGVTLLLMAAMVALLVIVALSHMAMAIVGIGGLIGIAISTVALAVALVAAVLVLAAAVLFAALSIVAVSIVIAFMVLEVVALIAATALFAGACVLIILTITAAIMTAIGLVALAVFALEAILLLSLLLLALAIAGGLKFVMDKVEAWWKKLGLAPFIDKLKAWWEGSQIKAWIEELLEGIKKAGGIKEYLREFVEKFLANDPNGKFIYDIIKGIQEHGGVWNYFDNTYHIKALASDVWQKIKDLLYDLIMEILFDIKAEAPSEQQKSATAEGFNPGSMTAATPDGIENAQPQFNTPSIDGVKMPQSNNNQNKGDLIDIQDAKASIDSCEEAMKTSNDELAQAELDISNQAQAYHQQKAKEEEETSQSMDDINSKLHTLDDEMHKQQDEIATNSVMGGIAGGAAGGHQDSNSLCHENR